MKCDVLIVGAGPAGAVMAERLSSAGKRCIVVDKRSHIAGNCHDYVDHVKVLVHKFGPHFFHTNSDKVLDYLSRFTGWLPAQYDVRSYTRDALWNLPLNLSTYEQLLGRASTPEEMAEHLESVRVRYDYPKNAEEAIVSQVGWKFYEMFYFGYTLKQWQRHPRDLDPSVCLRLPIRTTRDNRYFNDKHQCMPADGYTKMFERMLEGIPVQLGVDGKWAQKNIEHEHLIWTAPIDLFFDYTFGRLQYRSLRFEHLSYLGDQLRAQGLKDFLQPCVAINYPNTEEYTRSVEIKHVTGHYSRNTTIVREYPMPCGENDEPFYPIPAADTRARYAAYKGMADRTRGVTFVGRLATYRYLNMDQVVAEALHEAEVLCAN